MWKSYLLAARPKTLPAAIVPVWVGCVLVWQLTDRIDWVLAGFTVVGALCIQIATNLFNDAVDAEKGADTEGRLGPRRVTAGGLLSRRAVYGGAVLFLGLACLASLPLIEARGWPIIAIGLPSLYLSYGYTGGPVPLAYLGLGELFVILFFGLVAVEGTHFVQTGEWGWEALVLGIQVGLLSAVLIAINNLRDVEEDRGSGKRTLAVRFGPRVVQNLVLLMVVTAFLLTICGTFYGARWFFPLSLPWFFLGLWVVRAVRRSEPGPAYNLYLALAALQLVLFAVSLTVAGAIS
ncbi:MAG: 1,4-dihydroxy-2-naphthoate octaprenyltransferase [Akkermansiaceae bacterium]|nr:1,4-dihydroxy-2-naphthoate octaprenyltransferase [Akkermansiaceae bacterium]